MAVLKIRNENGDFVSVTTIKGEPGQAGQSAYQAAITGGYTGSESDFNQALANVGDIGSVLDAINGEVI